MVENIIIVGAGGFGREIEWLLNRINKQKKIFNILGFLDDDINQNIKTSKLSILGKIEDVLKYEESTNIVIAIANSKIRKQVIEKIKMIKNFRFPNIIDPDAIIDENILKGEGNIICANSIFTVDIQINNFNIINLKCTIGHDVNIRDFVTLYPNVNISGNVNINSCVEIGTGTQVIQGKTIGENSIIGAGSVVIRNIENDVTAVGVPTRILSK